MTRLTSEWIAEMEENAADWNDELQDRTGMGYLDLAAVVSGKTVDQIKQATENHKVAAVTITSGLGTIGSFAESVAAIVRAMGFNSFVTTRTDVDGIYEAYQKDADIIFMADDDRYISINTKTGAVGDNNIATAAGYAEILLELAGLTHGAGGAAFAVLGYGIIGKLMAGYLAGKGAEVFVYDKDPSKREAVEADGHRWIEKAEDLKQFRYIGDATSEGNWLGSDLLHEEAVISAPGIPFSLTEEARQQWEGRYVHDLLEIGTACMAGLAL